MDQNEACFSFTTVEFSNELDATSDWGSNFWVEVVVVVVNALWIFVIFKFPVIKSVTVCILQKRLTIPNSIGGELQRLS